MNVTMTRQLPSASWKRPRRGTLKTLLIEKGATAKSIKDVLVLILDAGVEVGDVQIRRIFMRTFLRVCTSVSKQAPRLTEFLNLGQDDGTKAFSVWDLTRSTFRIYLNDIPDDEFCRVMVKMVMTGMFRAW